MFFFYYQLVQIVLKVLHFEHLYELYETCDGNYLNILWIYKKHGRFRRYNK